jgi:hypothetical protein
MEKFEARGKLPRARANTNSLRQMPAQVAARQTAHYIADLLLELRNLAKGQGLVTVQGLLEVAYYEAFAASMEIKLPNGELERLREMGRASAAGK